MTPFRAKEKHLKDLSSRCHSHSISICPCTFKTTYKESIIHTYHRLFRTYGSFLKCSAFGYALDLLVTVSSMCYHTSTSALSTSSSSRGLTNLTLWDISS